jgi:hypothetical protein
MGRLSRSTGEAAIMLDTGHARRQRQLADASFDLRRQCVDAGDLGEPGVLALLLAAMTDDSAVEPRWRPPEWRRLPADRRRREIALHEAGHCVFAERFAPGSVIETWIENDAGRCRRYLIGRPAEDLLISVAGRVAAGVIDGRSQELGGADGIHARLEASQISTDVDETLRAALAIARGYVTVWRDSIVAVATALGRFDRLDGDSVRMIVGRFPPEAV